MTDITAVSASSHQSKLKAHNKTFQSGTSVTMPTDGSGPKSLQDSSLSNFKPAYKWMQTQRVSWMRKEDLELVTAYWRSPCFQLLSFHIPKLRVFWPHNSLTLSVLKTTLCTRMTQWSWLCRLEETRTPAAQKPLLPVPEGSW